MRIANNTTSFNIWTSYTKNLGNLQSSMGKLSTGKIANTDDPAGIGIADRMSSTIASTEQAYKNGQNATSLLQTADSWLSQVSDNLSRMKELAVECQGVTSSSDKTNLETEYSSLQDEITRISSRYTSAAKFNGLYLFRGGDGVAVNSTDAVASGKISVQIGSDVDQKIQLDLSDLQVTNKAIIGTVHTYSYDDSASSSGSVTPGYVYTFSGLNDISAAGYDAIFAGGPSGSGYAAALSSLGIADLPSDAVYEGYTATANAGEYTFEFSSPSIPIGSTATSNYLVSSLHTPVSWGSVIDTNLMSVSSNASIGAIDLAVNYVAKARASMGSQQSRIDKTDDALLSYQDNLESAKSKISDIDMASETTKYSTYNVLTQSADAMLAQANQLPSSLVLSLIQG